MTIITYRIHLDEPAIFSALEGDPNSAVSYPYIPGSAIRGLVIGRHIRHQKRRDPEFELDAGSDYKDLFFSAKTRHLNAYPVINNQRALPVPATWSVPKYMRKNETNNLEEKPNKDPIYVTDSGLSERTQNTEEERRKPKSLSGFVTIDGERALIYKPEMLSQVHNARARRDATEQQVFRYISLADGQTFAGAILCDSEDDADYILQLLNDDPQIVLGGSRSAGYGGAYLEDVQLEPNWTEVSHQEIGSETILTFLSDTILRDANGCYVPTPEAFQTNLANLGINCTVTAVSIKTTWVGGFNRKWGLPLPQTIAIERGSVVKLQGIEPQSEAIRDLLRFGIGERCEEGFGRVALGWQNQLPESLIYQKVKHDQPIPSQGKLSDESAKLWETINRRIDNTRQQEVIREILQSDAYQVRGTISRTQISRLRSIISNTLRQKQTSTSAIVPFLAQIKGKSAGRQFDNARIGGMSFTDWLKEPFKDKALEDNARLQLVDLVLERAYRERDKRAEQGVN